MISAADARFIELWQQGLETAAIARRLGITAAAAQSRAPRLQQRGLIQPRPRGGTYPAQRRQAALAGVSPDTPGVSRRVSSDTCKPSAGVSRRVSADTPAPQYLPPSQGEMLPLLTDILQELRQLTGALAARVSGGVSRRTPLPAERGKSVRWNLHLSEGVRERIKAMATARGLQDSQLVEELLWLALAVVEEAR